MDISEDFGGGVMDSLRPFEDWLDSYLNFEKLPQKNIFWLDTMEFLCNKLGPPQDAVPCFHVAGSKGKGSISCMIASILTQAGYKTGLYTSPHIQTLKERISSPKGFFSDEVYLSSAEELKACVSSIPASQLPGGRPLTWFELVTLFGMLCFKNARVDYSVYEVGLGGRLDATNVVRPLCSCIGPIELEHTEYLGDTLEKIAAEKAGIIKSGVPLVVSAQKSSKVRKVFEKKAKEAGSRIIFADKCSKVCKLVYKNKLTNGSFASVEGDERSLGMEITIKSPLFSRPLRTTLRMLGKVQAQNACVAALAVKTALPQVDEETIEKGLSEAFLPARFEILGKKDGLPLMILDGAHTVNSVGYTLKTLQSLVGIGNMKRVHVLYASAADKDVESIARLFKGRCRRLTLTRPGLVKQCDLPRLNAAFQSAGLSSCLVEDTEEAFFKASQCALDEGGLLLVTGSFYLVAEVKKILQSPRG